MNWDEAYRYHSRYGVWPAGWDRYRAMAAQEEAAELARASRASVNVYQTYRPSPAELTNAANIARAQGDAHAEWKKKDHEDRIKRLVQWHKDWYEGSKSEGEKQEDLVWGSIPYLAWGGVVLYFGIIALVLL